MSRRITLNCWKLHIFFFFQYIDISKLKLPMITIYECHLVIITLNSINIHTVDKTGLNDRNMNKLASADWKWAPARLTSNFLQDDSTSSLHRSLLLSPLMRKAVNLTNSVWQLPFFYVFISWTFDTIYNTLRNLWIYCSLFQWTVVWNYL